MFALGDQDFRTSTSVGSAFAAFLLACLFLTLSAPGALADPGDVVITSPVEATTYVDSSSAPVLEITNSGDIAHQSCKLDNSAYAECNNFYFTGVRAANGPHSYSVRTVDGDGDVEVQKINFQMNDLTAPTISAAVAPNSSNVVEDPVTSELAVDLSTDDESARIYAWLDDQGSDRANASGPVFRWYPKNLSSGAHAAHFLVVDGAGNSSSVTVSFTSADVTAPIVTINSPAAAQVLATGDFFADFEASDVSANYTCRVDNAPTMQCGPSSTLQLNNVAAGAHTFNVTASDNAGNSATTSQNFSVTDAPASGLAITTPADGAVYNAQPVLTFTSVDPIEPSSLHCSLNGGNFKRCDAGSPIAGIDSNGAWTLKVRALNDVGVQVSDTSAFTVADATGPIVTVGTVPATIADITDFIPDVTLEDSLADGNPTYSTTATCEIDAGPAIDCEEAFFFNTEPAFSPGPTELKITAIDWIGNSSTATITFDITDTTAPSLQILSPDNTFALTEDSVTVDFVATGGAMKFECQVNTEPRQSCSAGTNDGLLSWSPSDLPSGGVTLNVYAFDNAGNSSTAAVTVNNADTTGPTLVFLSPSNGATFTDKVVAHVLSGEQIFKLRCGVGSSAASLATEPVECWVSASDNHTATFRPSAIAAGAQTLWIEASDNQGNVTVISRAINVNDAAEPDLFFDGTTLDGGATTPSAPETLEFSSTDPAVHFTCSIDGQPATACGSGGHGTLSLAPSANVSHTIVVQAIDPSGNITQKSISYTVNDTERPELRIYGVIGGQAVGTSVVSTFTTRGAVATECAVDAAAFAACAGTGWTANFTTSGAHILRYRATDAAGNSTVKSVSVISTVPTTPVDPAVDPPVVAPIPAPPVLPSATVTFSAFKPKVTRRVVTIPVLAAVKLPVGVAVASGCSGKAAIALIIRKKTVKKTTASLKIVRGKCKIILKLKLKPKVVAGKKFRISAKFAGNASITKFYVVRAGKAGRAR